MLDWDCVRTARQIRERCRDLALLDDPGPGDAVSQKELEEKNQQRGCERVTDWTGRKGIFAHSPGTGERTQRKKPAKHPRPAMCQLPVRDRSQESAAIM